MNMQASCVFDTAHSVLCLLYFDIDAQRSIVLDGVPPAAITTLQGAGYLPMDLAFSLGGGALSDHRRVTYFSATGITHVESCSRLE